MLVLQHVWRRWTKASRAAADAKARLALPEAFALKTPAGPIGAHEIWAHEARALEADGFAVQERARPLTHDAWEHETPAHPANLGWRREGEGFELTLSPPWESMRRTAWPAHLPSPISVVRPGEVVRIDWNGRFLSSVGGSDRSYFYDWHTYWLTVADAPDREVFLSTSPRKHVDLRTRIY